ncbi:MAG: YbjN domain-containing protein [Phenylobacterium zucineum]|nr:MAG: YbjN domain-containing protein [Phenylobacterium zucineum]
MKRTILAAAAALSLVAGGAQARPIPDAGLTIEELLAFMKSAGFEATIQRTDDGERYIATKKDGINFDIDVYDCEKSRCRAIQFVATFELKTKLSAAKLNEWNLNKRYVRLYARNDGDPAFAYDANVAPGGTYEALQDDVDVFILFIPDMLEHIGW